MKNANEQLIQFVNCNILRKHNIYKEDLWVRNGKIIDPVAVYFDEKTVADKVIDCKGLVIASAFIDVQINGAFGVDFSYEVENVEKGLAKVAHGVLAHGVTSLCPTVITSPQEKYHKILPLIKKTSGNSDGAGILGVHVEGPFISPEKNGAHPRELIRKFNRGFKDVEETYGSLENICLVTLAPELPNGRKVIEEFSSRGIAVSLGHSMANLAEGEMAMRSGATFITHLFNAMLPFHHRDPGLVGLLTSDALPCGRSVFYGIIADGIHTHPAALRIAYRTHPKGLILVTDAISLMGLPPGVHHLGNQEVEIIDNKALVVGTNTLCGSITTMNECIKHFKKATGCSTVDALECASLHPAQMLGVTDKKGTLDFESDADFVIIDEDLNVLATYIAGQCVWEKNPGAIIKERNNV